MHSQQPYPGVSFHKELKKYRAYIKINKKQKHIGYFNSPEEAALARDHYILKHNLPHKLAIMESIQLTSYQEKAIQQIKEKNYRAILALKPGYGKSFTGLMIAKEIKARHTLIVAPKSKLSEWEKDIQKLFPTIPTFIQTGGGIINWGQPGFYLTTYQSIINFDSFPFDYFIFDESTTTKETDTTLAKNILQVLKNAKPKAIICLTGTPALNHPYEVYAQLHLLNYDNPAFISWEEFVNKYCIGFFDTRYHKFRITGVKDYKGLKSFITPYLVTLNEEDTKREVKLPPLKLKLIRIQNNRKNLTPEQIGLAKTRRALQLVQKILTKNKTEQVVLFTWHKSVGEALQEALPKAAFIHGQTSIKQREKILDQFKRGEIQFLICNIKAAGIGINLQNAHIGIMVELIWQPKLVEQAIKRLHRKGQQKPVYIALLVLENSLDEKKLKTWKRKKRLIEEVLPL